MKKVTFLDIFEPSAGPDIEGVDGETNNSGGPTRIKKSPTKSKDARSELVFVSPFDVHTYPIDVPPLRNDRLLAAVRYRLRALHPGNPERTSIEVRRNGPDRDKGLALVTDTAVAEYYRSLRSRISAPVLALLAATKGREERLIAIFWTRMWLEAALLEDGRILHVETIPGGDDSGAVLERAIARLLDDKDPPSIVIILRDDEASPEERELDDALLSAGFQTREFVEVSRMHDRAIDEGRSLFIAQRGKRRVLPYLLSVLILLDLGLALSAAWRMANRKVEQAAIAKRAYNAEKAGTAKLEESRKILKDLEEEYATLASRSSISVYDIITEISRCVGPGALVKSLVLRGDTLSIEVDGADALQVLERFGTSPIIASMTLKQATPSEKGGESFSLTGTVRR